MMSAVLIKAQASGCVLACTKHDKRAEVRPTNWPDKDDRRVHLRPGPRMVRSRQGAAAVWLLLLLGGAHAAGWALDTECGVPGSPCDIVSDVNIRCYSRTQYLVCNQNVWSGPLSCGSNTVCYAGMCTYEATGQQFCGPRYALGASWASCFAIVR